MTTKPAGTVSKSPTGTAARCAMACCAGPSWSARSKVLKFKVAAVPGDMRKLTRPIHCAAESTDTAPKTTGAPPSSAAATASSNPSKVPTRQVLVSSAKAITLSRVTTSATPGGSAGKAARPTAAAPNGRSQAGEPHRWMGRARGAESGARSSNTWANTLPGRPVLSAPAAAVCQ